MLDSSPARTRFTELRSLLAAPPASTRATSSIMPRHQKSYRLGTVWGQRWRADEEGQTLLLCELRRSAVFSGEYVYDDCASYRCTARRWRQWVQHTYNWQLQ